MIMKRARHGSVRVVMRSSRTRGVEKARLRVNDSMSENSTPDIEFCPTVRGAVGGADVAPTAAALTAATEVAASPRQIPRQQALHAAHVALYVCLWYCTSVTLTLFNKWMFSHNLPFPLLITTFHIATKIPACRLCMCIFSVRAPSFDGGHGRRVLLREVAPSGVATAADIALSNLSYLFISVTFYTIIKSSVPLWIVVFSVCYGLLLVRPSLVVSVLCITGGIALATFKEVEGSEAPPAVTPAPEANLTALAAANVTVAMNAARLQLRRLLAAVDETADGSQPVVGAALVLGASLSAGFRWACTQKLLTARSPPPGQAGSVVPARRTPYWQGLVPLTLLYYSSPFGVAALLPLALAQEGRAFAAFVAPLGVFDGLAVVGMICVGAVLAFFLLLTELRVVQALAYRLLACHFLTYHF